MAHKDTDSGEFAFLICKLGLEEVLGRRCKIGELITLEVNIKEVA